MRAFLALLAGGCALSCAGQPALTPRRISPDAVLIFEQRRAHSEAGSGNVEWEAWQLYESGRLVYSRAGAEPSRTRLARARLRAVRSWLARHDFELVQSHAGGTAMPNSGESASCQLHLSTGLVLAPLGDPRFYACDTLRQLSEAGPEGD